MQWMVPWTHKHQPTTTLGICGQDAAVKQLQSLLSPGASRQQKKNAILYGPAGSGKTSSVHALARDSGLEIVEINASDVRNKEGISQMVGNAVKQQSLFFRGKIILVDELDGLSGTHDYGGIPALSALMQESSFPIICTAENPFDKKFSDLRKQAAMIEYQPLEAAVVAGILRRVADKEQLAVGDDALQSIARLSGGDARAAINDLQSLSMLGKDISSVSIDMLSERQRTRSMIDALLMVFKTVDPSIAMPAFDDVDEDLDKIFLWVDENLPSEYKRPIDLARAYDYVSQADIMKRRIRRWQDWRFLVYINAYLSAGVAVSKDAKYPAFTKYQPTTRILKLWQANMKYQRRKSIAEKVAEKTHTSVRRTVHDTLPYLGVMLKQNPEFQEQAVRDFKLDDEDVAWMIK